MAVWLAMQEREPQVGANCGCWRVPALGRKNLFFCYPTLTHQFRSSAATSRLPSFMVAPIFCT